MAHRKHSHYSNRRNRDRSLEAVYTQDHTERLGPPEYPYTRYTEQREAPRRRRWAAGYIDRHSCPSHAYISNHARSPPDSLSDTERISRSENREEDYINAREPRHQQSPEYTYSRRHSPPRHARHSSPPAKSTRYDRNYYSDADPQFHGSDVDDLDHPRSRARISTSPLPTSDTEESDIIIINHPRRGSDIASPRRRFGSTRSTGSLGGESDVLVKDRGRGDSSDSEGGYISLDEYIDGRSDCVSKRGVSDGDGDDDGEGSDAVGSDVERVSSVGEGSDVVSLEGGYGDDEWIDEGGWGAKQR